MVVWHDENITEEKCIDTEPAVCLVHPSAAPPIPLNGRDRVGIQEPGDPDFPYVGKFIANLTLAQLQTLDCGSKRLNYFRTCSHCRLLCADRRIIDLRFSPNFQHSSSHILARAYLLWKKSSRSQSARTRSVRSSGTSNRKLTRSSRIKLWAWMTLCRNNMQCLWRVRIGRLLL